MDNKITDYTRCGICSQCGERCSSLLPITNNEILEIRKYIKKNKIQEMKCNFPFHGEVTDMTCPFKNNTTKKCNIYEVRPKICRIFMCNKPVNHKLLANNTQDLRRYKVFDMREFFKEEK